MFSAIRTTFLASFLTSCVFVAAPLAAQEPTLPKGPCTFSKEDPAAAAEKCKAIAATGDADAMFQLGVMLFALGDRQGGKWIDDAAEKGSKQAIELKCRMGSDPLAPAPRREEGKKWCDRLSR